jgi:hypothetical protein
MLLKREEKDQKTIPPTLSRGSAAQSIGRASVTIMYGIVIAVRMSDSNHEVPDDAQCRSRKAIY